MLVVEALVSSLPPCPGLVDLLLLLCQRHPSDATWQEWLLQLLIPMCYSSKPVASGASWLQLVQWVGRRSLSSAEGVCKEALRAHPWHLGLWRVHVAAAGEGEGGVTLGFRVRVYEKLMWQQHVIWEGEG